MKKLISILLLISLFFTNTSINYSYQSQNLENKSKTVLVKVLDTKANFSNVTYEQIWQWLWQVKFDLPWNYQEVWFDMWDGTKQILTPETDNNYSLYLYNENCSTDCDFTGKLYVKDTANTLVYYSNNKTLAYADTTGNIWIASSDLQINSVSGIWMMYQLIWSNSQVAQQLKKIDVTKHIRNWDTLSQKDKDDFQDWILDTLTLNGLWDLALNVFGWFLIGQVATQIWTALIAKFGTRIWFKLGVKMVPILWRAVFWYTIATIWAENGTYALNCTSDLDKTFDEKWPTYYCWKLVVNAMFVGAWIWISHVFDKYAFKKAFTVKLENVQLSAKAEQRMNETWRFVPISILTETIINWKKLSDPQWTNAFMFYSVINRNGKDYNLEVLYSPTDNSIWHFLYTQDPIWPLPSLIK